MKWAHFLVRTNGAIVDLGILRWTNLNFECAFVFTSKRKRLTDYLYTCWCVVWWSSCRSSFFFLLSFCLWIVPSSWLVMRKNIKGEDLQFGTQGARLHYWFVRIYYQPEDEWCSEKNKFYTAVVLLISCCKNIFLYYNHCSYYIMMVGTRRGMLLLIATIQQLAPPGGAP